MTRRVGIADGTADEATESRKFTLIDALVLIAALAIAFYPIRDYLDFVADAHFLYSLGPHWTVISIWRDGTLLSGLLAPLAVSLSLAVWVLRLKQPRPNWRRVFRQPGMVACTATIVETTIFLVKAVLSQYYLQVSAGYVAPLHRLWISRLPWNGEVVAIAWLVLWLSGSWRPEASWIDRAGRVLGVYWIISGVFFDYLQRFLDRTAKHRTHAPPR